MQRKEEMPGGNQLSLLESLPIGVLDYLIKLPAFETLPLLRKTSKTLYSNIITPRYEEILPWFLTASQEQIYPFIPYYRTTKEYAQLKSMQFTETDTLALLCFMLVTDDINLLPLHLLEPLLKQKEPPLPQLTQAQWEILQVGIKATVYAIKYGSNPNLENQSHLQEALKQVTCFVNLSRARLQKIDLSFLTLRKVNFEKADLQKANLNHAKLQGVNLKNTNLKEIWLAHSELELANLQGSNFQKSKLYQANLQKANLEEAQLQGADLTEAQMDGINLKGAHFIDAISDLSELKTKLEDADKQIRNHRQKKLLRASILSDFFRKTYQFENQKELLKMAFMQKIFGSESPVLLFFERRVPIPILLTPSQKSIKEAEQALAKSQPKKSYRVWRPTDSCENSQIQTSRTRCH